jgi:hypothetical protein
MGQARDGEQLIIHGVDLTHARLVDLTRLADQAKPFYDWLESKFRAHFDSADTLDQILRGADKAALESAILACYQAKSEAGLPLLFDGVGRSYPHAKACYYMFSWLIRDAPQQRLGPLLQRICRNAKIGRSQAEAQALAALFDKYRGHIKTFAWEAIREVILDRLEGSRRSLKGHEKETIVRTAFLAAIQGHFTANGNYGEYAQVELAAKEVVIGNESFDVSANLFNVEGRCRRRVLVTIKTRETEGGGHAHLFTRDIKAALSAVKFGNSEDFLVAVIVARNWSEREAETIRQLVDHAAIFNLSPNEFNAFDEVEQARLDDFVAALLQGRISPKTNLRN